MGPGVSAERRLPLLASCGRAAAPLFANPTPASPHKPTSAASSCRARHASRRASAARRRAAISASAPSTRPGSPASTPSGRCGRYSAARIWFVRSVIWRTPSADASADRVRAALVAVSATRTAVCAGRRHWRCSSGVGGAAVGAGLPATAPGTETAQPAAAAGVAGDESAAARSGSADMAALQSRALGPRPPRHHAAALTPAAPRSSGRAPPRRAAPARATRRTRAARRTAGGARRRRPGGGATRR